MVTAGDGIPFFDVVFAQRACREYADDPVDDETVELIMRAGTHAPSAENKQPWEFVVVRDPASQKVIHDCVEAAWHDYAREMSEPRLTPELFKEVDYGQAGGGYRTAPVLVVVCADMERGLASTAPASIFPCVQNMLLAAAALGFASALTTIGTHAKDELRELLALPETVVPMAILPIGRPARKPGPPKRMPVAEHAHRDRYGEPWTTR
jgi:nitroreductase